MKFRVFLKLGFYLRKQTNLNELRRPDAAHPQEAALGRGPPHTREDVEDVGLDKHALEADHLVVVGQRVIDQDLELVFWPVLVDGAPQLHHQVVVLLQPPSVLHVEQCRILEHAKLNQLIK